jgi:nitrogen fixation/metabolism regulation signal transduction histidine kinase
MKTSRWSKTTIESNGFLEHLFDAITDPVIIFDTELRIVMINKVGKRHFFPEHSVGKKCFAIKHTMAPICKDCPAWQSIRTGKNAFAKMYDPDTGHTLLIKTYPIFNEDGAVSAVALIGHLPFLKEGRSEN